MSKCTYWRSSVRSYWAKNKWALLQELAHQALSLDTIQLSSATQELQQSKPERTDTNNLNGHNIMNFKSTSSSESLVYCVNNGGLMSQQLLTISSLLVAASHQIPIDFTSATDIDQLNHCRVRLHHAPPTFKGTHILNLKTLVCLWNRNFHNRLPGRRNTRLHRRRLVRIWPFRSPNESQGNQRATWTGLPDRRHLRRLGYIICSRPP